MSMDICSSIIMYCDPQTCHYLVMNGKRRYAQSFLLPIACPIGGKQKKAQEWRVAKPGRQSKGRRSCCPANGPYAWSLYRRTVHRRISPLPRELLPDKSLDVLFFLNGIHLFKKPYTCFSSDLCLLRGSRRGVFQECGKPVEAVECSEQSG